MLRPNRALCVAALGLAALIGCKKSEPTEAAQATAPPAAQPTPQPAPAKPAAKPGDGTAAPANGNGGFNPISAMATAAGPLMRGAPSEGSVGGQVPPTPGVTPTPGPAASPAPVPGQVELIQCRFEKVEAALAAAKGKVVLVDCWARWCPPCVASFPKLVEKHEKYKGKGLVCMSVSLDQGQKRFNTEQVFAFLKQNNSTLQNFYLTNLQADNARMEAKFGEISGIPHAVLFSRAGVKIWEGHPMDPALVKRLEAELAK